MLQALAQRTGSMRSALLVLSLTLMATLSACGGSTPQTATLLKAAQDKFNSTTSLHFVMTMDHAGTGSLDNPYPTGVLGDVQMPDKVNATATVNVGIGSVPVTVIIIGQDEWWTNPVDNNAYEKTDDFAPLLNFFDPKVGVPSLLAGLQNPSQPSNGSANGTDCWKVSGTLPQDSLKTLLPGEIVASAPVPTTFCIDKSTNQLLSATLTGNIAQGDTDQTVRTFYFSKFDQPVSIQPPAGS